MLSISPEWIPAGNAVYSDLSATVSIKDDTPDNTGGVALPAKVNSAIIYFSGQAVHIETDGTDATTNQPKYPASQFLLVDNNRTLLANMNLIEAAASARADIWWFIAPGG